MCRSFRDAARLAELPTELLFGDAKLCNLLHGLRQRQHLHQERQRRQQEGQSQAVAAPYGSSVNSFRLRANDAACSLYVAGCMDVVRNVQYLNLSFDSDGLVVLELPLLPRLRELCIDAQLLQLG